MLTREDLKKLALSMTICIAEIEMSARVMDMSGEDQMADTLDALAQKMRDTRDSFFFNQRHKNEQ